MKKLSILILVGLVCGSGWAVGKDLSYVDLVKRLTDLQHLATVPAPGEQCAQWSSYDRRSRYDAATRQVCRLGRQRRRRRHHPQRGRPARLGRDEGAGLHLADLVGRRRRRAMCRSTWMARASRRWTCRSSATSTGRTRRSPIRPSCTTVGTGLEQLHADPLPEVVQDRRRPGLGRLLPVHLRDLSRRAPRCRPSSAICPPRMLAALDKANAVLSQSAAPTRPARTPAEDRRPRR